MNRKTRLFLVVGIGVLVVGVGVAALASYLGLSAIALGGVEGPADLKYVPADARVVAYADLRALMTSEARRAFLKHHEEPGRVSALESATGIDPERDIDSTLVFIGGKPPDGKDRPAILARGRFDAVRIEGLIRQHGGESIDYKGKRFMHRAGEDGDIAAAFLEPDLLAFGSAADVRHSIDLANGGPNITTNDRMMGLLHELNPGNLWAFGNFDAVARADRLPREVAARIPAVTWFAASARVDSSVDASLHLEARDDAAAKDLRDVAQGMIAMGRLQAQKGAAAADVLDSVQLGGTGRKVSVEFTIPSGAVARFASGFPARR